MGGGTWSNVAYRSMSDARLRSTGGKTTMAYSHTTAAKPREEQKVHEDLDPKKLNADDKKIRESRDSDEHPEALPIAVIFDETGSMGHIPEILQAKLAELMGVLLRKGYVEHPHILMGAVGDATDYKGKGWGNEVAPLQIGQFESDERFADDLTKIFLEGMGGGSREESYDLALYFFARHTSHDSWEKRNKKGYLFLVGDEKGYPHVTPEQVKRIIGDTIQAPIPFDEILTEAQKTFHVYMIVPNSPSYGHSHLAWWTDKIGQNAIKLDDDKAVCETIALAVGLNEGSVDLEEGLDDLKDAGFDPAAIEAAGKALAKVAGTGSGGVAKVEGDLDLSD